MTDIRIPHDLMADQCGRAIQRVQSVGWFKRVGTPPRIWEQSDVEKYLRILGFREIKVRFVHNLQEVEERVSMEFDERWKHAEFSQAQRLHDEWSENREYGASFVFRRMFDAIFDPIIEQAKDRMSSVDSYLSRVAAGSAAETSFLYALESIGDAFDLTHTCTAFTQKFKIFENGRWPLCLKDGVFSVY